MSRMERNKLPESAAAVEAETSWPAAEDVVRHAELDELAESVRDSVPEASQAPFDRLVAFHTREVQTVRGKLASVKHTIQETADAHQRIAMESDALAAEVRRLETQLYKVKLGKGDELSLELQWVRSAPGEVAQLRPDGVLPGACVLRLIQLVYAEKVAADAADDAAREPRQSLRAFVYDFFLATFGVQTFAETNLWMLLKCIEQCAEVSARLGRVRGVSGCPRRPRGLAQCALSAAPLMLGALTSTCRRSPPSCCSARCAAPRAAASRPCRCTPLTFTPASSPSSTRPWQRPPPPSVPPASTRCGWRRRWRWRRRAWTDA
jgi:hypothetical protein